MLEAMLDPEVLAPERVRPLLAAEYQRLVAEGLFEDERIELLRGVLVEMSPQGPGHLRITAWLAQQFGSQLDVERYDVRAHSPFAATRDSIPEPDVSISKPSTGKTHPFEAHLLIEVSASSLKKDRVLKPAIYAEAGVPEYWIVDVKRAVVHVLTRPTRSGYERERVVAPQAVLRPSRLRGVRIELAKLPWGSPDDDDLAPRRPR